MKAAFDSFATAISAATGSAWAFVGYIVLVVVWSASGPLLGFSDTWQLVANTATTLITTALVLLVQHSQNKDTKALNLKLDALIDASAAQNTMIDIEHLSDDALAGIEQEMQRRRAGLAQ